MCVRVRACVCVCESHVFHVYHTSFKRGLSRYFYGALEADGDVWSVRAPHSRLPLTYLSLRTRAT